MQNISPALFEKFLKASQVITPEGKKWLRKNFKSYSPDLQKQIFDVLWEEVMEREKLYYDWNSEILKTRYNSLIKSH